MTTPPIKPPTDDADLYKSGVYILMDEISSDSCILFKEKKNWYKATKKSYDKWKNERCPHN